MACNDRQLSQAQREAGYDQQRTGVPQAIRPFSGTPTLENLIDYLNRELVPVVRGARGAVNDVYLQVADQAPSANPLAYYFSTNVAASDPTSGFIKLNQATQNTASIIRVSQSNGRLQDVTPWLDVMSGGPTTPLGTVTLIDAINPGRFLRFDLNTMTDQGAYWDLGVTFIEGSHTDPFVDDEAVVLAFISGVSAAGSTVPVGSISPIATDTVIGNISGSTAPPAEVPLADLDSTSIVYDATSHTFQRAALTGFATASQNSNATSSAEPIVTYSASPNMSAERVLTSSTSNTISTAVANQIAVQRAALTGAIAASADANATVFSGIRDNGSAENDRTNLNFLSGNAITVAVADDSGNDELEISAAYTGSTSNINLTSLTGAQGVVDISTLECGGSVTIQTVSADYSIAGFTAKTDGFWFALVDRRTSGTTVGTLLEESGATTTSLRNPTNEELYLAAGEKAFIYYVNNRHRVVPGVSVRGRLLDRTVYTSGSGTHTYGSRTRRAVVKMVGAGGGGGGVEGGAVGTGGAAGGGGGAGAYLELDITSVPTSSAYAVGTGGTAGAASGGGTGGTGGDTTFHDGSATRTAGGGTGGTGDTLDATTHIGGQPGAGGSLPSSTGAFFRAAGNPGAQGVFFFLEGIEQGWSGTGGAGPFGGAGAGNFDTEAAGNDADGPGSGGGGGYTESTTDRAGGAGENGIIIVEEYS